ncbi:hypothetical protein CRV08_08375 [Halarcobacter ebronensis]|uniref:Lipoprotein n=1 Tax=Halarcobacter ebronensis TaxID=1462615 RepID=A0A4Q0YCV5_9BACT|nr:hypothetical protein [Halarcobacter ebronensis]RXJ68257.1 hypothetical protein CRV08_08375 [Halarcobacter ebronensis]
MKINQLIIFAVALLFSACSVNHQPYLDKEVKGPITKLSVIASKSNLKMQIKNNPKYTIENIKEKCKNNSDEVFNSILNKSGIYGELTSRNIEHINFGEETNYLMVIQPINYYSKNENACEPTKIDYEITLADISGITKDWNTKTKAKRINELAKQLKKKIIWKDIITWDYDINPTTNDKNINHYFNEKISQSIDKTGLFPPKVIDINKAIIINQEKYKKNLEKEKSTSTAKYQSDSMRVLSAINCNINDRLAIGYSKQSNALCLGKLSFINAKQDYSSQKLSMLNASEKHTIFTLNNSTCPVIATSEASGSKYDKNVSFKKAYKTQILEHFKNRCREDVIDGINFMTCGEKNKSYFLELSSSNENRIYKKYMIQVGELCFDKLKKYYNNDDLDSIWRTMYGYNKFGFDAKGYNILTDSKYDKDGFDYNNWNKDGINRLTKTKYDIEGFDINKISKDGTDKDGWNPHLKKFVKKKIEKKYHSIDIVKFDSQLKNNLYNRSYYNNLSYIKEKDGFKFVGKKVYGDILKPKKIETYYFRSAREKLLDFDKSNKPIMNDALVLEKIDTREFDKDGYDKDGYDKDGWNAKLKTFKK